MGSAAEESETFYDSLEEEVEELPDRVSDPFAGLPDFRTPPNTSRFLNCFDNLDVGTKATLRRNLTVSPATDAEEDDMDYLATAFQNLSLEDEAPPTTASARSRSTRRNVRRSKSCTSLSGKNPGAATKKMGKLRQESLTSFRNKCTSYLEMYQRRKGQRHEAKQRHKKPATELLDPVPPPTTRTSYDDFSCSASLHDLENATYQNVGDFKVFPADVGQYMSINLNSDGLDWRPRNVVQQPLASGDLVHHHHRRGSYVPYSIKDYKSLQVPKLGSLGYDREAVRDKYEKMKRQRAYGMQASVRNRSKMALAQKAAAAAVAGAAAPGGVDHQKAAAAPPPKPPAAAAPQSKAIRRHHAQRSRCGKTIPKKAQGDGQSSLDLQPLVERHLKEMQASAIIRQNFMCL